jgi:hypothetical protein
VAAPTSQNNKTIRTHGTNALSQYSSHRPHQGLQGKRPKCQCLGNWLGHQLHTPHSTHVLASRLAWLSCSYKQMGTETHTTTNHHNFRLCTSQVIGYASLSACTRCISVPRNLRCQDATCKYAAQKRVKVPEHASTTYHLHIGQSQAVGKTSKGGRYYCQHTSPQPRNR